MTHPPPAVLATDAVPDGVQQRLDRLRSELMGGRGPGASASELAAHKHERTTLGTLPVTVERERVSVRASVARGASGAEDRVRQARESGGRIAPARPDRESPSRSSPWVPLALGVLLGALVAGVASRRPRPVADVRVRRSGRRR
ncbi:MAG: hypothetical protein ACRDPB_10295 [Nocardioidaceae bacterium]